MLRSYTASPLHYINSFLGIRFTFSVNPSLHTRTDMGSYFYNSKRSKILAYNFFLVEMCRKKDQMVKLLK